jgi:segregation and condensation protein B
MELIYIIEALLFSNPRPLSLKRLSDITGELEFTLENVIKQLVSTYAARGIIIRQVAGGYQMVTNPAVAPFIKKLRKATHSGRLSQASLETLAIIAYKQPVTRQEVEKIRGVKSGKIIPDLLQKKLIKTTGKSQTFGKFPLYATTIEFLQYFNLNSLEELPPLEELPTGKENLNENF